MFTVIGFMLTGITVGYLFRNIAFLQKTEGGSRNLVGIAIQLSDSEEEKLFVHDSMQVSPE